MQQLVVPWQGVVGVELLGEYALQISTSPSGHAVFLLGSVQHSLLESSFTIPRQLGRLARPGTIFESAHALCVVAAAPLANPRLAIAQPLGDPCHGPAFQ